MNEKKMGTFVPEELQDTKISNFCQLARVLEYFLHNVGTSLDCAFATGILRNCITWYIRDLLRMNLLRAVYVGRDRRTGFMANHYTADRSKWPVANENTQYELKFEEVQPWMM